MDNVLRSRSLLVKGFDKGLQASDPACNFGIIFFFTLFLPSILIKVKHADNTEHS